MVCFQVFKDGTENQWWRYNSSWDWQIQRSQSNRKTKPKGTMTKPSSHRGKLHGRKRCYSSRSDGKMALTIVLSNPPSLLQHWLREEFAFHFTGSGYVMLVSILRSSCNRFLKNTQPGRRGEGGPCDREQGRAQGSRNGGRKQKRQHEQ